MYIFQIKKWWDKIKRELDLCGYTNLLLSWEPYESLALEEEVHSIAGKCNAKSPSGPSTACLSHFLRYGFGFCV